MEVLWCWRFAIEIPSAKDDTHNFAPGFYLASVEHCVHFARVRFVVDHGAVDLDPRMGLKWDLLCADD